MTARHYAKWIESDGYREPLTIQAGEVPADLLARLGGEKSDPTSDPGTQIRVVSEGGETLQVPTPPWESMARREGLEPPFPSLRSYDLLATRSQIALRFEERFKVRKVPKNQ